MESVAGTASLIDANVEDVLKFILDDGGTFARVYGIEKSELDAVYAMGYMHYKQGNWDDAFKLFGWLVLHDHLERRNYVAAGNCLMMKHQYEAALRLYGVAHVLDVSDPIVALHISDCLIKLGRREDALTALESTHAIAGDDPGKAAVAERAQALVNLLQRGGTE